MVFNDEQKKKFVQHLDSVWEKQNCWICSSDNWTILDKAFQVTEFFPGSLLTAGKVMPFVALVCNKCGNTLFLNAYKVGVLKVEPTEVEKGHAEEK
ncbi:hypothetical protein EPO34_00265 [Patescibacteria group bacterium]|nr:MAG: hypothetical protein EPO34_00265 [Patescibacteria group bacterium]